jgi:hypothetical protein
MMDNGLIIKEKDREIIIGPMEMFLVVIGKTINDSEKE